MPTACLCWKWRTWWSWVINPTPNVSSPTYSLWSTTCADTRCPWVGPVTSDLCSVSIHLWRGVHKGVVTRHPYPSPTPPSPATSSSDDRLYADGLGHRVAHLRWTSWGLCVCLCVSVCLLSLLAVVMCIHFFAHFLVRGRQSFYKTFLSFEILVHCFFVLNLLFVPVSIQHAVTVSLCTRAERHLKR